MLLCYIHLAASLWIEVAINEHTYRVYQHMDVVYCLLHGLHSFSEQKTSCVLFPKQK